MLFLTREMRLCDSACTMTAVVGDCAGDAEDLQ